MNLKKSNKLTPQLKNYLHVRDRYENELEWVRANSFIDHSLPRPIGLINGCYDMLHSGHMKVIFQARERCRTLVCAMDSDKLTRDKKGPTRPVMSWVERATALGYMPIDMLVEIDSDEEMQELIKGLKPDFRVQGVEYKDHPTRFPRLKRLFVRSEGMRTSEVIRRILSDKK